MRFHIQLKRLARRDGHGYERKSVDVTLSDAEGLTSRPGTRFFALLRMTRASHFHTKSVDVTLSNAKGLTCRPGTRFFAPLRMTRASYFQSKLNVLMMVLLFLLALSSGAGLALAQETGYLEGQAVNQTEGGGVPANIPVTLIVLKDMSMQDRLNAQADGEGRFRFDGLDTSESSVYQVVAEYKGVDYFSDFLAFEDGKIPSLTVDVYEPTEEQTNVHTERLHVIINVRPRQLQVGELHVFSNPSDRAYVGHSTEMSGTLRFSLPTGANDLEFQEGQLGGRFASTDEGFLDTSPVLPGTGSHQVLFSYNLDYDSPEFSFSVTDYYSVTGVNVLVSDPAVQVDSPALQSEGFRNVQGQEWVSLAGKNLPAGQEIRLSFSNLPLEQRESPMPPAGATGPLAQTDNFKFIVLGLALFGLGVLVGYSLPRRERVQEAASFQLPDDSVAGGAEADEDELIVALADLDDAFERGEVSEGPYRQQRADLKKQLAAQQKKR